MVATPAALDAVVLRYCRRRIDRALKRVDLNNAQTEAALASEYSKSTGSVNFQQLAQRRRDQIQSAVNSSDLAALLAIYDNKGMLGVAASKLKSTPKHAFEEWLTRILSSGNAPSIVAAFRAVLPKIAPS